MTTWLKPAEVAKRLGISRRQVYYLIAKGEIPAVQFSPQTTRVDEKHVTAYIEKSKRCVN